MSRQERRQSRAVQLQSLCTFSGKEVDHGVRSHRQQDKVQANVSTQKSSGTSPKSRGDTSDLASQLIQVVEGAVTTNDGYAAAGQLTSEAKSTGCLPAEGFPSSLPPQPLPLAPAKGRGSDWTAPKPPIHISHSKRTRNRVNSQQVPRATLSWGTLNPGALSPLA